MTTAGKVFVYENVAGSEPDNYKWDTISEIYGISRYKPIPSYTDNAGSNLGSSLAFAGNGRSFLALLL